MTDTNNKKAQSGCVSGTLFFIVILLGFAWGIKQFKSTEFYKNNDTKNYINSIIKSNKELLIGKWKIVSVESYVQGKTNIVYPQKNGNNALVGSLQNPKFFLFTKENEFIRTRSDGKVMYIPFEIIGDKLVSGSDEKIIIELSSKKLILKEELHMSPLPGKENLMGKVFYTFTAEKVK